LITGADGFIGSHLAERLLGEGAVVSVWVRPRSVTGTVGFELRNLGPVQERFQEIVAADIAGADAVHRVCDIEPAVIFHLAADAYVERSFEQPQEVLRTNLGGTLTVLQAVRRRPSIERVVITSSSEVYGSAQTERIDETHPLEPTSPYASSKLAADRMAVAYHRTYGSAVAVIRPFNTYGPRHVYDVIPKFVNLALRGKPLEIYGAGTQSRDFTYVDDMVEAFMHMGRHPAAIGRVVNFGCGTATGIEELARMVLEITGSEVPILHRPARQAEVNRLCCDHRLATELFGWRPRVTLMDGLRRHVEWARDRG
jgi:nucleoside-diphosphate-sugar epimerase